ncbi:hypothetical protein [Aestuariispira insulae]|uniref:Uncharacterized protein n=1 Tax=Aestuariispira insulae TaxID=1461337 RepID=A0A3D9HVF1_9PROT|nr:hypothetical protein [Aestuariispira insulae]RED53468.1 hypothetical protein DFP90_101257 [Aestuariispira insulae]
MEQNKMAAAAAVAMICLLGAPQTGGAASHALLALVYGEDGGSIAEQLATAVVENDCVVKRMGPVLGEAGAINLDQPEQFIWLTCDQAVDLEAAGFAGLVNGPDRRPVLLVGRQTDFPEDDSASDYRNRAYILKVSHFNNDKPPRRRKDLEQIRNWTLDRKDRYRRESFMRVQAASGMETPDEAVLLFYDSPLHGERFRENNPDILEAIEAFNDAHLNDHTYYFAGAAQ